MTAGRAAALTIADERAASRRMVPDRRTRARRVEAEHRRLRLQAADALDRALRLSPKTAYFVGEYNPLPAARAIDERAVAIERAMAALSDALAELRRVTP